MEIALQGFEDPIGSGKKYVVAKTHEQLLERLITKERAKVQKQLDDPAKLQEWHEKPKKA